MFVCIECFEYDVTDVTTCFSQGQVLEDTLEVRIYGFMLWSKLLHFSIQIWWMK